jgi:hypothetical protein
MAIYLPTTSDSLTRTSGVGGAGVSFTWSFWLRLRTAYTGVRTYAFLGSSGATYVQLGAQSSSSDLTLTAHNNAGSTLSTSATNAVLTVMTWYYVSTVFVYDSFSPNTSTMNLIVDGAFVASVTINYAGTTAETFGSNAFSAVQSGFDIAYDRAHGANINFVAGSILNERSSPIAVRLRNLQQDTPLTSTTNLNDYSGKSVAAFTASGTPVTSTSPSLDAWQMDQVDLVWAPAGSA